MRKEKYTKEILEKLVKESETLSDLVRKLTLKTKVHGNMVDTIKKKLIKFEINFEHFKGRGWSKGKINSNGVSLTKEEFIVNYLSKTPKRKTNTNNIKNYLYKFGIKENKCELCCGGDTWNGLPISNQLDHIDGNSENNELDNLRILCPNCHSQTSTFTGKNVKMEE